MRPPGRLYNKEILWSLCRETLGQASLHPSLTGESDMTISMLAGDLASSIIVLGVFSEADDLAAAAALFILLFV